MTEIKVETIHLGGAFDKGCMTLGEVCLFVEPDKDRNDIFFKRAGLMLGRVAR